MPNFEMNLQALNPEVPRNSSGTFRIEEKPRPRTRPFKPSDTPKILHCCRTTNVGGRGPNMNTGFIHKRKKRKSNCYLASLIGSSLLLIAMAKLICDTYWRSSDQLDNVGGLVQFVTAFSSGGDDNSAAEERFLPGQPMDTVILVGQPADLVCLVENKRANLAWLKNEFGVGIEEIWPIYAQRYSLTIRTTNTSANQSQLTDGQPIMNSSPSPPPPQQASISNYTLHIKNVSLDDDDQFYCTIGKLKSRKAKLTVWKPPSQLFVAAKTSTSDDDNDLITLLDFDSSNQTHQHRMAKPGQRQDSDLASEQLSTSETAIQRITVNRNSRLRLECRTDAAKPQTELVWLDGQERRVPKRTAQLGSANDSYLAADSMADELMATSGVTEFVEANPKEPRLTNSSIIWSFRVNQNHANQIFTCQAYHVAFENRQLLSSSFGKQLKLQVQLDVQYPPERIEIIKEPSQAFENRPIKFQCSAQAHPNQLTYRWFIDNQLVANATEPELQIERLTRQMHMRELRCEVTNSVGSESATHRLAVLYAPVFVTHLLPASLQPPLPPSSEPALTATGQLRNVQQQQQQQHQQVNQNKALSRTLRLPTDGELLLGRQLAIGFERGDDIHLRCDFDSNPRLKQVQWFKMNTEYDIMANVTPQEADSLIEGGAAHAIFREQATWMAGEQSGGGLRWHDKRHISATNGHLQANRLVDERIVSTWNQQPDQLDYEQMSSELLDELAAYDTSRVTSSVGPTVNQDGADPMAQQHQGHQHQVVEPISSLSPSSTASKIDEPLGWIVARWPSSQVRQLNVLSSGAAGHQQQQSSLGSEQPSMGRKTTILSLVQPTGAGNGTTRKGAIQAKLLKREVSLSSSLILIKSANEDSTGKYVCKSKPAEGFPPMARALYLVQRKEPRVISHSRQWAPAGAQHIQIECLAEVRAVVDNMTTISWTKSGQPIHEMLNSMNEQQTTSPLGTNISITLERSPDFLYVRSVLRIESDELDNYFGPYNCTITNSRGTDHLIVDLQKEKSTGFVFAAMVSIAVSTVLLLACLCGLIIVCTPRRKLEAKSQAVVSQSARLGGSPIDNINQRSKKEQAKLDKLDGSVSSSCDRKSPRSLDSQEDMLDQAATGVHLAEQQENNQALTNGSAHYLQPVERSGSAFEPARGDNGDNAGNQYANKMRSSLRHPAQLNSTHQQHQRVSDRFAAISESLEHKLQRGPQQVFAARAPSGEPGQRQVSELGEQHQVAVAELERDTLISRLWTRLLMKPERAPAVSTGRRLKSRPIISMPVNVNHSSSAIRRSSVSLSRMNGVANAAQTMDTVTNNCNQNTKVGSLNSNHINGGHLVSSKANLIQDSTTASDGTASSGRSSSSSGTANNQQLANGGGLTGSMLAPIGYPGSVGYLQQQQAMWMQQQQPPELHQVSGASPKLMLAEHLNTLAGATNMPLDCGLYVNETSNSAGYNQAPEQAHLYTNAVAYLSPLANPYSAQQPFQEQDHHPGQMINGYATQPLGWTNHSQSASQIGMGHYQLSMLANNGESQFSAAPQQQQVGRAYYATINGKQVAERQQQQQQQNFNQTSGNYGTLPVRLPPTQLVVTSDVGDAYFDANYGTLLSRANKTLYPTSSTSSTTQQNCHSSSSSPCSLTTHTNNTLTNHSSRDNAQHLPTLNLSSQALLNGDNKFSDNQMAVVHSDGSTIATNASLPTGEANLNDKGLATHV